MRTEDRAGHEEATVQQLADLYDLHKQSVSPVQRFANRATSALGRPLALAVIVAGVIVWTVGNEAMRLLGARPPEQFPFPDLGFVATIVALIVALLILTTQRHDEEIADRRARLTLQIAILSEKKIAKLIELVEEQRRDNPLLPARIDREAMEMATPTDPRSSIERLEAVERNAS